MSEGSVKEVVRLKRRLEEDLSSGTPPHTAYWRYVLALLELVSEVYIFERGVVLEMHELLSELFRSYLGIPPPPVSISDKTPSEYLEEVLNYAFEELGRKLTRPTKLQTRQEVELRTLQVLSTVCELLLTMYAPPHIA